MCNLSEGIWLDGIAEGRAEGEKKGQNELADLMKYLVTTGRREDADRVIFDPEYRQEMLKKFQLQPA